MQIRRRPRPVLAPWVRCVWAAESGPPPTARELALPNGETHVVLRLTGEPIRLRDDPDAATCEDYGHAVVGGARTTPWLRETGAPTRVVGLQLRPGGAAALLGVPAEEIAGRHVALADLWGTRRVASLLDEIASGATLGVCLNRLEAAASEELPDATAPNSVVADALARLVASPGARIAAVSRAVGYSERGFTALFRREVGIGPKAWARVLRFQRAIALLAAGGRSSLAELAIAAGYSDQAHLTREFRALGGITPGRYRPASSERPNHVPVPA